MNSRQPQLCVIVPTINEEQVLPALLESLASQQGIQFEVIIADGGSSDGTIQLAERQGVRIVRTGAGRGLQMNTAAACTSAPYLLFLHADSELTSSHQLLESMQAIQGRSQLPGRNRVAGHFRLRFRRAGRNNRLAYRYYQEKSGLNRPECTNGDQGFLLPQDFFRELGGFDESLRFLEDQRLAETIRARGGWITLPGELVTSARRFEQEGLGRRMILSALIMNFHQIGFVEFFQRARDLYPNQDRTGPLALAPLFRLINDLNREAGTKMARQRWLATGGYVLRNAWQIFFFFDITASHLTGTPRRLFLAFYDQLLAPAARSRLLAYPSAGLTWLWYRMSWLYFSFRDGRTGSA